MKQSTTKSMLPARTRRGLANFGANIAIARKRRGITTMMMAERIGIGRATYARIEKGDPAVSIGAYAMALFALGIDGGLAHIADPQSDDTGTLLDISALPKRIHAKREPQTK